MKSIIEKLGMTKGPLEWVDDGEYKALQTKAVDSVDMHEIVIGHFYNTGHTETFFPDDCDKNLIASAPEMLEALIENAIILEWRAKVQGGFGAMEKYYNNQVSVIEKATGRTWQEVKELIE